MNGAHRKTLIIFLIIAIIIAAFLTYRGISNDPDSVLPETPAQSNEVKGSQVDQAAVAPYDDSLITSHLALTPDNVIWFTNYERVKNNLDPLNTSQLLDQSAYNKTSDMFAQQYFDHKRPDGTNTFNDFITAQKYQYIKAGENLARGDFKTSQDVVDAWMQSPGHRKNILDDSYVDIGVSVQKGVLDGVETTLITQQFGLPASDCPTVSTAMKNNILTLKNKISTAESNIQNQQTKISQTDPDDATYNDLVDAYNRLVDDYNGFTQQLQNLANTYNQQVQKFDTCVQGTAS